MIFFPFRKHILLKSAPQLVSCNNEHAVTKYSQDYGVSKMETAWNRYIILYTIYMILYRLALYYSEMNTLKQSNRARFPLDSTD